MKLRLYSDLHNEFDLFDMPLIEDEKNTVLLLAGDIGVARKHGTYAGFLDDAAQRHKAVVYVPGNHEYYGSSWYYAWDDIKQQTQGMRDEPLPNLHFLNGDTVEIDGTVFIGATLWTEMNAVQCGLAEAFINDYKVIKMIKRDGTEKLDIHTKKYEGKLRARYTVNRHFHQRDYIWKQLRLTRERGLQSVVVTHHAPSPQSIHAAYAKEGHINHAYFTDLEAEIIEHAPTYWVHGHMHNSFDYMVGDTRVLSNPRGYFQYVSHENRNFIEDGMIDGFETRED